MNIRPAQPDDADAIWEIIAPAIRAGETLALPRDMTPEQALAYWLGPDREIFVAEADGRIVGTYYLRSNQLGGGAHICNCGYVTAAEAYGRGIARAMCTDSLERALSTGYRAMQFNLVVSTNERAVRLWHSMGFRVVGTLPGAFHHPELGYVDAYVMYRTLAD